MEGHDSTRRPQRWGVAMDGSRSPMALVVLIPSSLDRAPAGAAALTAAPPGSFGSPPPLEGSDGCQVLEAFDHLEFESSCVSVSAVLRQAASTCGAACVARAQA